MFHYVGFCIGMRAEAGPIKYGIESRATMEVCLKWFQGANSNTKAKKKV